MTNIFLKKNSWLGIILSIYLAFLLLADQIKRPFAGHHDWNGVVYSNIARNYRRYGLWQTKLGEVTNYGYVTAKDFNFHTNHPVLFPLLLSIFFKIFGVSEWSARLFAIFFSLGSLYVFNLILKKIYQLKIGLFITPLMIFTPLFLYYAPMPVYEPVINFFILLTVYFYLLWRQSFKRNHFFLILISLFFSQMVEWPGYYLSLILFFHHFLFPVKKKRMAGAWWLVLALFSFSLVVFHQFILTGSLKGNLAKIFLWRLSGGTGQPFTLWQYGRLEFSRARSFFTTTFLGLVFLWLVTYFKKIVSRKKIKPHHHFIFFFIIFGLIHLLIFPNVAWYHDYMLYYLFFPFSLAAAFSLDKIFSWSKKYQYLIFIFLFLLVIFEKKKFLADLKKMKPYADCVLWGKEIKKGLRNPLIEVEDKEKANSCGPFTSFYADQPVNFKLKEGK